MTVSSDSTSSSCSSGATTCTIAHDPPTSLDGKRSILAVLTKDTQSITSIVVTPGGAAGGWTAQGSFTGQGKKWSLFDKICGPSEPAQFLITFSPAISGPSPANCVLAFLVDVTTDGDAIRATSSADSASGTTITLPSLTALAADDILAFVWDDPATTAGQLRASSPLTQGTSLTGGLDTWAQNGYESYRASSPTGTRQFAVTSGTHGGALAVMMIVGVHTPLLPVGGWAAGMIRMNQ